MALSERFFFRSHAASSKAFHVVRFKGSEGLSQLFRYKILLASNEKSLDASAMVRNPASLILEEKSGSLPIHGVLSRFEALDHYGAWTFYNAVLVPKLWRLTLTRSSQIFLGKSIQEFLPEILKEGGLSAQDFELKLSGSYPSREYVCQYNQSHFEFASYWMERDGLYYYFDHDADGKLVVTDSLEAHTALPTAKTLYYAPPSGLNQSKRDVGLAWFFLHQQFQPKSVLVRDYNPETPALEITGRADACPRGGGRVYLFGDNAAKPSEAEHLARVLAESCISREAVYEGKGSGPVRSGYTFTLQDHFRSGFNQSYLVTEVKRKGSQEAYVSSGLRIPEARREGGMFYRNTFMAIPSSVQFRAERKTPPARFHGAMNARIWTEGSDEYAQVDKQGRYKVKLPFDLSGRGPGKASHYVRMAQPYVGEDHGMHFPLHKGTEVLLTFVNGDPDRPVIEAVAPNPDHKSLITDSNHTEGVLTTSGKNMLHFHDQKNKQMIHMRSPTKTTWMRLGAAGGGVSAGIGMQTEGSRTQDVSQDSATSVGKNYDRSVDGKEGKTVQGDRQEVYDGENTKTYLGRKTESSLGKKTELKRGGGSEAAVNWTSILLNSNVVNKKLTELSAEYSQFNATSNEQTDSSTSSAGEKMNATLFGLSDTGKSFNFGGVFVSVAADAVAMNLTNNMVNMAHVSNTGSSVAFTGVKADICLSKIINVGSETTLKALQASMAGEENDTKGDDTILAAAKIKCVDLDVIE